MWPIIRIGKVSLRHQISSTGMAPTKSRASQAAAPNRNQSVTRRNQSCKTRGMQSKSAKRLALAALLGGAAGIGFAPILVRLSEVGPSATAFYRVLFALPFLAAAATL